MSRHGLNPCPSGRGARQGLLLNTAASIYTNSLPFATQNEALKTYGEFEGALYASL